jgi:hypothetical protein
VQNGKRDDAESQKSGDQTDVNVGKAASQAQQIA